MMDGDGSREQSGLLCPTVISRGPLGARGSWPEVHAMIPEEPQKKPCGEPDETNQAAVTLPFRGQFTTTA